MKAKVTNQIRSKVLKAAWKIYTKRYKVRSIENWSKALKRAWEWAKEVLLTIKGVTNYTVIRETEKAICIAGELYCVVTDQSVRSNLWIPKSLVKDGVIADWFFEKKVEEAISLHSNYGGGRTLQFELL